MISPIVRTIGDPAEFEFRVGDDDAAMFGMRGSARI
jgi:hypothetical protein